MLYQVKYLWVLSTQDRTIARLEGPVTGCAEVADRVLALGDWNALNEAAKRGEEAPKDFAVKVYEATYDWRSACSG